MEALCAAAFCPSPLTLRETYGRFPGDPFSPLGRYRDYLDDDARQNENR